MNKNPLILTLDFGTQSVRVALTNKKGDFVALIKRSYSVAYKTPEKGYAEQDADYYYESVMDCLKELGQNYKEDCQNIIGATITTFRDTAVLLDKDLKPLRPCILWLDQRQAEASEPIPWYHWAAFWLVGMKETILLNRRRTMAHWVKENQPELWDKTCKYVNISTYLTYKFTGKLVDSVASVIGHYPIDFKNRKWYKEGNMRARIFGVPNSMLCDLKQPGELLGYICDDIADECGLPHGIKMIATGSDKACETIGLGALRNDIAAVSCGTASTIEVSNKKYHEPEPLLPAYPAAAAGWYNMDVQIYRGYWMLKWYTENFANGLDEEAAKLGVTTESLLDKRLKDIPAGSDGLVLQPFWGPGLSKPLSKGSIIGFTDTHTNAHIYRAIIEGIAYALRDGLEGIEKSQKRKVNMIRISGGGSKSNDICQIVADVFGLPVSRVQTIEATTLGAALSTFVALKEFSSIEEATNAMVHVLDVFKPIHDNHDKYEYLYRKVYLKMFPLLKDVEKDISIYRNTK